MSIISKLKNIFSDHQQIEDPIETQLQLLMPLLSNHSKPIQFPFKLKKLPREALEIYVALLQSIHAKRPHEFWVLPFELIEKTLHYFPESGLASRSFEPLYEYSFGAQMAPVVMYALAQQHYAAQGRFYPRFAERRPRSPKACLVKQFHLLKELSYQFDFEDETGKKVFYRLSLDAQLNNLDKTQHCWYLAPLWAAAIDLDTTYFYSNLIKLVREGNHEKGLNKLLIKTLLLSKKPRAWKVLEELLLNSGAQEGLRLSILEELDEANLDALRYFVKVIVEHKLYRFSSIIKALSQWLSYNFSVHKSTNYESIFHTIDTCLNHPARIREYSQSSVPMDVYIALWAQSVLDVELSVDVLTEVVQHPSQDCRMLAVLRARYLHETDLLLSFFTKTIHQAEVALRDESGDSQFGLAWVSLFYSQLCHCDSLEHYTTEELFFELLAWMPMITQATSKQHIGFLNGDVTHYEIADFYRLLVCLANKQEHCYEQLLPYLASWPVDARTSFFRSLLSPWLRLESDLSLYPPLLDFQKKMLRLAIQDKSYEINSIAINVLTYASQNIEELSIIFLLLKSKRVDLKLRLIELFNAKKVALRIACIDKFIAESGVAQRLTLLELILANKNISDFFEYIPRWLGILKALARLSAAEATLIEQIEDAKKDPNIFYSKKNGYQLYLPQTIVPVSLPLTNHPYYDKRLAKNAYGLSLPLAKVKKNLAELENLFSAHGDYEYECVETLNDFMTVTNTYLLANKVTYKQFPLGVHTPQECFELFPLWSVWLEWYEKSGLDEVDLWIILLSISLDSQKVWASADSFLCFELRSYFAKREAVRFLRPMHDILWALFNFKKHANQDNLFDFSVSLSRSLLRELLKKPALLVEMFEDHSVLQIVHLATLDNFFIKPAKELSAEQTTELLIFAHIFISVAPDRNKVISLLPLELYLRAYDLALMDKNELLERLCCPDALKVLANYLTKPWSFRPINYTQDYPFVPELLGEIAHAFFAIELQRTTSVTPVSELILYMERFEGLSRLIQLLEKFKKLKNKTFAISPSRYDLDERNVFSTMLKVCYPASTDTQEQFNSSIESLALSPKRLLEVAIYAPQWQTWIESYLNWTGLHSAIAWMEAHSLSSKTNSYVPESIQSRFVQFSPFSYQDFIDGLVDRAWFMDCYQQLGEERWEMLNTAVHYFVDSKGKSRSKLIAQVLKGAVSLETIQEKILATRNQEYLRVYGLAPLDPLKPQQDVLVRYEFIQQFLKETRHAGALRQNSEKLSVQVALDNLARHAGFDEPARLTWAMESLQLADSMQHSNFQADTDTSINLLVNDLGLPFLEINKAGKLLKSLPPSLKKIPQVVALKAQQKRLLTQARRVRLALEKAMIAEDKFSIEEIFSFSQHPIIKPLLNKLVLIDDKGQIGFLKGKSLCDVQGRTRDLSSETSSFVRIAHCLDLHQSGVWLDYQRYCFDHELQQPFKQIFRELYVPTSDELSDKFLSSRYAGYQIVPSKAFAMFKARGWFYDADMGLQYVSHRYKLRVRLWAALDWFSPAGVESPTLDHLDFSSLATNQLIAIDDIPPVLFSEIMRDVDLVVSVAHAGLVNPESSQSSIELRVALLRETVRLFKLSNVRVLDKHVAINGKLAQYNVHLGSGIVHQVAGTYLSILPVNSHHRGPLFLPFLDDDPRSAEIMAKVLLLARDDKIKDPSILQQIR